MRFVPNSSRVAVLADPLDEPDPVVTSAVSPASQIPSPLESSNSAFEKTISGAWIVREKELSHESVLLEYEIIICALCPSGVE